MNTAVVCIDFINDIVSEGGKLAGKGYQEFARERNVLEALHNVQSAARGLAIPVIHVRVGFDAGYLTQPKGSPLFGAAQGAGALSEGSWGTEYTPGVEPVDGELSLTKPRVSAFRGTRLEPALRALGVSTLILTGVATDLAVLATTFDGHDRDFNISVVEDACAAANGPDHERALVILSKLASITRSRNLFQSEEG